MLNYKKDYITLYKIDDISREEAKNAYLGCVYDEAVETFNKLCQSIDDSRPENFIDIKLYRIPIDFDITNKEQLFNALSANRISIKLILKTSKRPRLSDRGRFD